MKPSTYVATLSCGLHSLLACARNAPPYREALLLLHQSLVEIPSTTNNEAQVGDFLINYLSEKGFAVERQHIPSSNDTVPRFNVLAWPRNRPSNWSRVVVTSHIDTVPPHIGYSRSGPVPPTADTILAGRGAVDAKGAVAAQVMATLDLLSEGSVDGDDIMLTFIVGEEAGGVGMQHFSTVMAEQEHRPHAAIFGESTEGQLACGHKGGIGCEIVVSGKAAHRGYPEAGKSANELLMRALVKAQDTDLGSSERYGNTTLNVGIMQGGALINVIPGSARATILLRVALEWDDRKVSRKRLESVLAGVDKEAFDMQCPIEYGAVFTDCDVEG